MALLELIRGNQTFVDHFLLPDIYFNGHCLIKHNIYIPKKVVNLYISYTLNIQLRNLNADIALGITYLDLQS